MARNNKPGRIIKSTAIVPTLKKASGIWTLDEAMQAHRDNVWPQPNLYQPVANSLRMKASSNAYLLRAFNRTGSTKTGTISFWCKLGYNAGDQHVYQCADTSTNNFRFYMAFGSDGTFYVVGYNETGSSFFQFITSQLFRDPSAWYHIVVAIDSTQATQANRFKMYANGVQVTAFSTASYPAQGQLVAFSQQGSNQHVGSNRSGSSLWFAGHLSEVNFIDGYQLEPTFFGKYDTNNTWVPIAYTGSYGTNGFYLPFNNATTSQTLGYDASNTDTTDYDVDQDPYRGSVALHLTGNGPAGGQNNTFADSSPNNLAITRNGDVTQGSFSPFPMPANAPYNPAINGASAYFDGTGDYLSTPSTSNLSFGSGDFTIECWVYANTLGSYNAVFAQWPDNGGTTNNSYVLEAVSPNMVFYWASGSTLYGPATLGTIVTGQWTHYAICRSGNTLYPFKNGVLGTTTSITQTLNSPASAVTVGGQVAGGGGWNGFISNLRIVKGIAVYTAAFTPPRRPLGTRTNNLIAFSEDFTNTNFWITPAASVAATITSNSAIAPDGTPSASTVNYSVAGSTHPCFQNITFATANTSSCTASMYVKYSSGTTFALQNAFFNGAGVIQDGYGNITFANGVASVAASSANMTVSSTDVGNGWYRIKVTATNNSGGASTYSRVSIGQSGIVGSIYVWGAQLEVGSAATEYTPTPENYSTAPSLLLNFANAAVTDTAGAGNIVTVSNATVTSSAKYGSGAMTFNGSSDYFQSSWSLSSFLSPGSNNWTLETWVYMTKSLSSAQVIVGYGYESGSTRSFVWYYNGDGTFRLAQSPDGSTNYDAGFGSPQGGFALNTWYHLAIVRNSGAMTMYVNGKAMPNTLSAYTISSISTGYFRIGVESSTYFGGSMDDLRYTKGVARYTTDFTPPARALPEIGGKSFITQNINAGVVRAFTTTGTTSWTAPSDVSQVEVLVVGGGGGGATRHPGGGGAGGLIYNNSYPVTPGQTYTVTVGAGAAAVSGANINGNNGSNSVFGALTAIGGGYGGTYLQTGGVGGSGGGGGEGGISSGGLGIAGQGFAGGGQSVSSPAYSGGGGGGGAGAAGTSGNGSTAGSGGNGLQFGISGLPTYYAGGGGGAAYNLADGTGGLGGGGNGVTESSTPPNGTANTGGGGGGNATGSGTPYTSGAGGSGIVLIRYTTTAVGNTSDATTDNLVDSPTLYGHDTGAGGEVVGNYATWNPLDRSPTAVLSNGNLDITPGFSTQTITRATMSIPLGQWYFEVTCRSTAGDASAGEIGFNTTAARAIDGGYTTWAVNSIYYTGTNGNKTIFGTSTSYGATWTTNDIIGVAIDTVAGTIVFYKNGASQGTITNGLIAPNTLFPVFANNSTSGSRNVSANFGQRAWAYDPPAGYNALTTKNLPRLTGAAAAPNEYFNTVLYTGTGAALSITDVGFQPDLVWSKARNTGTPWHQLTDSVRGTTKQLFSNRPDAEDTNTDKLTSFDSDGFTLGSNGGINGSGNTYVAWCWKAGGAAVSNTAGSITSQVSANPTAGFSVVTYISNGVNGATVGHGLGVAPSMVIVKCRYTGTTQAWAVYHASTGATKYLLLNTTDAATTASTYWNNTAPSSTVFTIGTHNDVNINSSVYTYVAYCFADVEGYSKFGSYTGNGSATDGPFVYTGFRPAYIMAKVAVNQLNATGWQIWDAAREPYNPEILYFHANTSAAESDTAPVYHAIDLVSNGFKLRAADTYGMNQSGATYIYMAFAEKPFGNVNGTAR
jgi:hypothetical protein